ncbi:uncharacterized protein LOC143229265 isoform X2 [Tachypleus tridentatus]|uniref:uncharacterized protein LOC143229265 isoform X2 n=1 Tax=Tachypleus tridentatus TaxID=6853 RepID=UPI003FD0A557
MIMALRPMLRTALWLMLLMSLCVVASRYSAEEKSSVESDEKETKTNFTRFIFSRRDRKFPIIPPRLNFRPSFKPATSAPTFTTTTSNSTVNPEYDADDEDPFDISSSVHSPLIFWPVRRKIPSRIFSPLIPSSTTPKPLLKLLQPKPTRPAMYSLDGFVPEPSVRRITTTEAPSHIKELYKIRNLQILSKRKHKSLNSSANKLRNKNFGFTKEKTFSRFTAHRKKGIPGKDYPIFNHIPATGFVCGEIPGRYADPETGCQVWHLCPGGYNNFRHSFLCPNGTIFNERRGICDWWYNVSCELVLRH